MSSELRQDLVSGDWVLIAPGRGKRPDQFKEKAKREKQPKTGCIFENPKQAGGGLVILSSPNTKAWKLQVVPNKYPAVTQSGIWELHPNKTGPFSTLPGFGYHELLITRDHHKNFAALSPRDALLVFQAFRERYMEMAKDKNLAYISIFHNWGNKAGASVYHPHYQILGIPVVPPDVGHSLEGSRRYRQKHRKCVHCIQIEWEKKQKSRIIFEDKYAIAFMPYVSKEPFEMRVFPKCHRPYFEEMKDGELTHIVKALQTSLNKLEKALSRPDYNFFLHTSPVRNKKSDSHYHWHIEIVPRTNISAGFELGTDIEINPLDPDKAASFLNRY